VAQGRRYRDCARGEPLFRLGEGLAIEQVETWCRARSIAFKRMNGNIKNITPYLRLG
jgi:hypothetical protein